MGNLYLVKRWWKCVVNHFHIILFLRWLVCAWIKLLRCEPTAIQHRLSFFCMLLTLKWLSIIYQMNSTGCASLTFSTSTFFNSRFENNLQDTFLVNASVTEEGTGELLADLHQQHVWRKLSLCAHVRFHFPDVVMSKSATVSITFEAGKVMFVELPEFFDSGTTINGKASKSFTYKILLTGSLSQSLFLNRYPQLISMRPQLWAKWSMFWMVTSGPTNCCLIWLQTRMDKPRSPLTLQTFLKLIWIWWYDFFILLF